MLLYVCYHLQTKTPLCVVSSILPNGILYNISLIVLLYTICFLGLKAFHGQYVNYGCHVSMPHNIHVHGRVCIYMCTCKSKQHCPDNTCLTVFIHCSLLCGIIPMHACYKAYCINGGGKQWGYLTYLSTG